MSESQAQGHRPGEPTPGRRAAERLVEDVTAGLLRHDHGVATAEAGEDYLGLATGIAEARRLRPQPLVTLWGHDRS